VTDTKFSEIAGQRIKELRTARGWSVRRLVDECATVGFEVTSNVIENIEGIRRVDGSGKPKPRREISVDELLILSAVLDVHPVDMLVPPELADDEPYNVTAAHSMTAAGARAWIGGVVHNVSLIDEVRARRMPEPKVRREIRVAAGVSQVRMAEEIGVDRTTLIRWENGESQPRGDAGARYAKLLSDLHEVCS
jgi:transcriptional regulator with XRE-family HTH domain